MHRAAVSGHVKAMKYLAKEAKSLHSEYTSLPQVYGEAVFTLGELLAKHGPPIGFFFVISIFWVFNTLFRIYSNKHFAQGCKMAA